MARRYGFDYRTLRRAEVPARIRFRPPVGAVELHAPHHMSTAASLAEILLDDGYGLRRSQPRTILDIGANVGFFSIAARGAFPNATIHAYEPNHELAPYLDFHARQCGFKVFYEAVGDVEARVNLQTFQDSLQTQVIEEPSGSVKQSPFSLCIKRLGGRVDFVKCDCEGAEWSFITDSQSWVAVDRVALEYHLTTRHPDVAEVVKTLHDHGLRLVHHQKVRGTHGIIWAKRMSGAPRPSRSIAIAGT